MEMTWILKPAAQATMVWPNSCRVVCTRINTENQSHHVQPGFQAGKPARCAYRANHPCSAKAANHRMVRTTGCAFDLRLEFQKSVVGLVAAAPAGAGRDDLTRSTQIPTAPAMVSQGNPQT